MADKYVRINATLGKEMYEKIDEYARKHHEDRSTAIRQLIAAGLVEKNKEKVLEAYRNNKITLREAAELLGLTYWETQDLLVENDIPIINQTKKETQEKTRKIKKDKY